MAKIVNIVRFIKEGQSVNLFQLKTPSSVKHQYAFKMQAFLNQQPIGMEQCLRDLLRRSQEICAKRGESKQQSLMTSQASD